MEVLSSRILLRPAHPERSHRFYRDVLGLAVYREFGPRDSPGTVFFAGSGFIEVSGSEPAQASPTAMIWLQVRDVRAEYARIAAAPLADTGARVLREPVTEPWGLTEAWIADPDGTRIVLVEVPADHPIRRDTRSDLS